MKIYQCFQRGVIVIITIFSLFWITGCNDPDDFDPNVGPKGRAVYVRPGWLGGTNLEILEASPDYSIFIELMDKAGLREQIEKQLFTLFVPNNDAFNAYFAKHGYSSVDDLSDQEAETLFKYHYVKNGRSAYQLKYEFLWGEEQGPTGEYGSLFYRKGTAARSVPYVEKVRYNPEFKDQNNGELLIYTDYKLIPLMSRDFFEDFFGDPDGSDYLLMYPGSKWANDLNWHNAAVTQKEVPTASGFIYYIDQVVDNMESIEEYLIKNQDRFGVYYDLAQRFATYGNARTMDGYGETKLYKKNYNLIYNFADEYGPDNGGTERYKSTFTLYAPIDEVMQKYLDETVLKYYSSLDSVPSITLYYIVQSQLSQSFGLMSKIEKLYYNSFGDQMVINRDNVLGAQMCSNGPVYAMNSVIEPLVFTCVPRRLFFDSNYTTFLFALEKMEMLSLISDPNKDVTVFAVDNESMEASNIRYNEIDDRLMVRGDDGIWKTPNTIWLENFLADHIYDGVIDDLSGEGYIEMSSKNFVHYKNNKLEAGKNVANGETVDILDKEVNEKNGILYNVSNSIKSDYSLGQYILDHPEYSIFADSMISQGLLLPKNTDPFTGNVIPKITFLAEADYWTVFIPDNNAMEAALAQGLIPTDADGVKDFLYYHFIRKSVIFDNGELSGEFNTNSIASSTDGILYYKVTISNQANNLVVTDGAGNQVAVNHADANALVSGGVAHKITAVLTK